MKRSANKQFFVGAQTVVSLLQTTQMKQGVSFIAANKVYTSTNKNTHNRLNRDGTLSFTRGGCVSCLRACLGARLLLRSYYFNVPTLRAPLSGTFLQTLPDLVTPLKGHSLYGAAVQRRGQRPPKASGTNMTVKAH